MPLLDSLSPDVSESLPAQLGSGTGLAGAFPAGSGFDVSIGALGFRLRPSQAYPYQRSSQQTSKQQIDTSDDAGEQSLSAWWTRSQSSWDNGAGIVWYEPGSVAETVNRFASSQGIDVWTEGQFSLLHAAVDQALGALSERFVVAAQRSGVDGYIVVGGTDVAWYTAVGVSGATGTLPTAGCTKPTSMGSAVWVGHGGGVSKFVQSTGTVTTPWTASARTQVWWVKGRLIAAIGPSLYELTPAGTGVITDLTPLFTHPSATWTWCAVSETPGAIVAAGSDGGDSGAYRFRQEQDSLGQPILSSGEQVVHLPGGEYITNMRIYLGTQVVLCTSRGIRVGQAAATGEVQYGPITLETSKALGDIAFYGRFAYISVTAWMPDGKSGVVRIDLSSEIGKTGLYAWAADAVVTTTTSANSLCILGDGRVVLAVGGAVWLQSATVYVTSGWLDTGRIRYRTIELKAFRFARLVTALNGCSLSLTVAGPSGTWNRVAEMDATFATDQDMSIDIAGVSTLPYVSFKVTLSALVSTALATPTVTGLLVKALPAVSASRLIQFPLSVYDKEVGRNGNVYYAEGGAMARVLALESVEESGAPQRVTDRRTGESFVGKVEQVNFDSLAPPDRMEHGFGGVAMVTVRRL